MKELHVKKARFMSYVLRHNPKAIDGMTINSEGWTDTSNFVPKYMTQTELSEIVSSDSKGRFQMQIAMGIPQVRCVYGHSIEMVEQIGEVVPIGHPPLWHATNTAAYERIKKEGIKNMSRNLVHLSDNKQMAVNVALRYADGPNDVVLLKIINPEQIEGLKHSFGEIWTAPFVAVKNFEKENNDE